MNIGLIGAGAIGTFLLEKINKNKHEKLKITSVFVRNKEKYEALETEYDVKLYTDLDSFLDSNEIDIVVEAANVQLVESLLPIVIQKKDAVIISVGAFANKEMVADISRTAAEYGHVVHLPSGAVGGVDLLQNANALGTVKHVSLTTRKPAQSLVEEDIQGEKVVFEGKAVDAIHAFPKNMNVSIILSLAALGIDETKVQLIADTNVDKNTHHIEMEGEFGTANITVTNNPLPENPKTSYLAAMSTLGTLERLGQSIRIGG